MTIKKHQNEIGEELIHVYALKEFINNKLDELSKLKANSEFRIKNIVNSENYDYNDEYDREKISQINTEIKVLDGQIKAYGELMKELS